MRKRTQGDERKEAAATTTGDDIMNSQAETPICRNDFPNDIVCETNEKYCRPNINLALFLISVYHHYICVSINIPLNKRCTFQRETKKVQIMTEELSATVDHNRLRTHKYPGDSNPPRSQYLGAHKTIVHILTGSNYLSLFIGSIFRVNEMIYVNLHKFHPQ